MRSLEGQTALVTGGDGALGRAIALALSARGVRIVVTGREERALGETVGEIVHGGGKARHVAGDPSDEVHLSAAVARARDVFGGLDLVIHTGEPGVECTFRTAAPQRRMMAVLAAANPSGAAVAGLVRDHAPALFAKGVTCNAIILDGAQTDDAVDDGAPNVAELVVFLSAPPADGITAQTIHVRPPPPRPQRVI